MEKYYKNTTNGEIRVELFGVGTLVIPANAKSVALDHTVAASLNRMSRPYDVLEETDVVSDFKPIVPVDVVAEVVAEPDFEEMTKAEIKAILDERGIKYHRDANKTELIDLVNPDNDDAALDAFEAGVGLE